MTGSRRHSKRRRLGSISYNLPEGDYEASITYSTELPPGELTLDGEDIESGTLEIAFTLQVIRPKIQSHIDVATRGRSISLAPVKHGDTTLSINYTIT